MLERVSPTFGKWVKYILVYAYNGPLIIHFKLFSNHFNDMRKCSHKDFKCKSKTIKQTYRILIK